MKPQILLLALLLVVALSVSIKATDTKKHYGCASYKKSGSCRQATCKFNSKPTKCLWNGKSCSCPTNTCQLYSPTHGHWFGCERHKCFTSIGNGVINRLTSKKSEKCIIGSFNNRCLTNKKTDRCDCRCHRVPRKVRLPSGWFVKKSKKTVVDVGRCNGICPSHYKKSCKPVYNCITIVKKVGYYHKKPKATNTSKNTSKTSKLLYQYIKMSFRVIDRCNCMSYKQIKTYKDWTRGRCGNQCIAYKRCGNHCGKVNKKRICLPQYCKYNIFYKTPAQRKKHCGPMTCNRRCEHKFQKCLRSGKSFQKCYREYLTCKKSCQCTQHCKNHPHPKKCHRTCLNPKCYVRCPKALKVCLHGCSKMPYFRAVSCRRKCEKAATVCKRNCCKTCYQHGTSSKKKCYGYCRPRMQHCVRKSHSSCALTFKTCNKRCGTYKSSSRSMYCRKGCKIDYKRCPNECCIRSCSHLVGEKKQSCRHRCYLITSVVDKRCKHCNSARKKCLDKLKYIRASEEVIAKMRKKCNTDFARCNIKCRCSIRCKGKTGPEKTKCMKRCIHKSYPPKPSKYALCKKHCKKSRGFKLTICQYKCSCFHKKDRAACKKLRDVDDCDLCATICKQGQSHINMGKSAFTKKNLGKICRWCKTKEYKDQCFW